MRILLVASLAVLSLAACQKNPGEMPDEAAPPKSEKAGAPAVGPFGIDLSALDVATDAGDDFYEYVNGGWLKTFKIPDDYSSYGSFTVLGERAEQRIRALIEELAKNRPADGSNEQKVRDFYAAFLDQAAINARGLDPIAADLAAIDALASPAEAQSLYFNRSLRLGAPLSLFIAADAKDPSRYAIYLTQSGLGMPNRDYYLDEKFADARAKYRDYIRTIMTQAGVADAAGAADRIFEFETELASAHWEPAKRRNRDLTYNSKTVEQLEAYAPGAAWREMFAAAGLPSPIQIVVREDDAIQKTVELLQRTPLDSQKEYLKFQLINENTDVLPAAFDDASFAFYGAEIRGALKQKDRWKRAVAAVDASLGEAVGEIYVAQYFPASSKEEMSALVGTLRAALGQRLGALDWMSEETRARAEEKLANLSTKIGYPDKWRDYSTLTVAAGDAYGNARRAGKFAWDYRVARLGGPVDRSEWGLSPQTVNAYYNPTLNEVVFPAAILDAPFFDPQADDAVNYGAIGAVIGHEIGHGFDDQGRKSDGDGILRDWWTPADADAFKARAQKLGAQYATYEPIKGFTVNPDLTMGENIGDLGGLAMAYHAYKLSLDGAEAPVIDGLTGDQRFFLAWAQVWRRIVRDEQLRNQIASDPHAPAKYRVNGVVRNMDAWYEAFGVTPDDDLWLDPEARVQIW